MNKQRYVDISSIVQVIGGIYTNPSLLDDETRYKFSEEDFPEEFHKILFGSIYNLYKLGAKEITISAIEDYLAQRPKKLAIYKENRGEEYLNRILEVLQPSAFDYYYSKLRKMTLLRLYNEKAGMDLSWLYDINNIFDIKAKQAQEDWLDNTSLEDIANTIDQKIVDTRLSYVDSVNSDSQQAGANILQLLQSFKECPEVGIPMYGPLINTITRGARLKKFYLRSAPSGVGKTRAMIADACTFSCGEIYNEQTQLWDKTGVSEPTLYITTEQELSEIQTMMLAFLSAVDEEHILKGEYEGTEWDRIKYAAALLEKAPLYVVELPDFSLQDVENTIKREIHQHDVKYVCHDYIHTSMKILSEVSTKAGIKGLREDNVLFMISVKLKDIANEYGVFIESSTQLNGEWQHAEVFDQNLLRGAKSIADWIKQNIRKIFSFRNSRP